MNTNFALLYSANCRPQQTWARHLLDSTPFRRKNYERIIDAGCGTGEVTNIILERFPDAKEIYAFDISPEMINVARELNDDSKISYNIGAVDDVESLNSSQINSNPGEFDLFTSFLVLHWVQDHNKALTTIQTTLAPGGEFLLLFLAKRPLSLKIISQTLRRKPKWAEYLANFQPEGVFSQSWAQNNNLHVDPASGYKQMCEDAGLNVISSKLIQMNYIFSTEKDLKLFLKPILSELSVIPQEFVTEFMNDAIKVYKKYECGILQHKVQLLSVHGFKHGADSLN